MNNAADYNHAHLINPDSDERPKEAVIAAYREVFFELEVVTVGGIEITLNDALAEISLNESNQLFTLSMRGESEKVTELTIEILTKHAESLIIDALASN
jgi:hypothetical protein